MRSGNNRMGEIETVEMPPGLDYQSPGGVSYPENFYEMAFAKSLRVPRWRAEEAKARGLSEQETVLVVSEALHDMVIALDRLSMLSPERRECFAQMVFEEMAHLDVPHASWVLACLRGTAMERHFKKGSGQ